MWGVERLLCDLPNFRLGSTPGFQATETTAIQCPDSSCPARPTGFERTTPWSENNKAWQQARRAMGVPDRHIDDVRDTFGTQLAQVLEETIGAILKLLRPGLTAYYLSSKYQS